MPVWFAISVFSILGLAFGSFFNVLIHRMPLGQSLWAPPSHCPRCNHAIRWYHNVPVLGWLVLQGKCADCSLPIPFRYPAVEALGGFLGALAGYMAVYTYGEEQIFPWVQAFVLFWLLLGAVPIFFIDIEHHLIPDTISLGGVALGFVLCWLPGGIGWQESLLGAIVAGGALFLFGWLGARIMAKEAMGLGDVKLLAGYGALLGWQSALMTVVLAAFMALACVLPIRLLVKKKEADPVDDTTEESLDSDSTIPAGAIPFGPFLALAAPIIMLWGQPLLSWYMGLFGIV